MTKKIGWLLVTAVLGVTSAWAQPSGAPPTGSGSGSGGGGSGDGGRPHGPPPEAVAACKTLSSGQACSFTSPHGTLNGTCWAPQGKPLACKPSQPPPSQPPARK